MYYTAGVFIFVYTHEGWVWVFVGDGVERVIQRHVVTYECFLLSIFVSTPFQILIKFGFYFLSFSCLSSYFLSHNKIHPEKNGFHYGQSNTAEDWISSIYWNYMMWFIVIEHVAKKKLHLKTWNFPTRSVWFCCFPHGTCTAVHRDPRRNTTFLMRFYSRPACLWFGLPGISCLRGQGYTRSVTG